MSPIFKGPIFVSHRTAAKRQRALTALPVARGVVNEQDFLQGSGRATRDEVATGRRMGKTLTTMAEKHRRAIKPLLTPDEIATSLNESKAIREEAEKIVATFGRGSIARAEEDLRFVIDERKEMSPQDFEGITDYLRGRMDLQSFISTEKNSDWFWEYSKEQSRDRQ